MEVEDPAAPQSPILRGFSIFPLSKDSNLRSLIQGCASPVSARTSASGNCADLQLFCTNLGFGLSGAHWLVTARSQHGCSKEARRCDRAVLVYCHLQGFYKLPNLDSNQD